MEETKLQHVNTFKVVGLLVKADVKTGISSKGSEYVSATATIKSVIGGVDNEFEIDFYSNKLTGAGKVSSLYTAYENMASLEGKKVEITGSIRENRYFSSNLGQMISAQELAGRFIKGVAATASDDATFEMSGFVTKILSEKKNKADEIYRYDLTIAQANYSGSAIAMYVLHVDPSKVEIVRGVSNYEVGQTVRLNGSLMFKVETVTSEAKNEGGFGQGVVRTYINRQKNFFITGGSAPINDETKYDGASIREFVDGYKSRDVELMEKGKTSGKPVENAAPVVTKKQTSLI